MTVFWLFIVLLLLIALAFVLWPVLRKSNTLQIERKQINLTVHRQQLRDAEREYAEGKLTKDDYQAMKCEIEASTLQDDDTDTTVLSNTTDKAWFISLCVLIPIIALVFYFSFGSSSELPTYFHAQQQQQQATQMLKQLKTPQAIIAKMQQAIQQHPNDAKGWYLLGRLYFDSNDMKQAEAAFAKANQLKSDQPDIMLMYAQALYVTQGQKLTTQSRALLSKVIAKQPGNQGVINLMAMDAYQQGHYQQAIDYWQQLLAETSADTPNGKALLQAINHAKQKLKH
tara:strand:- start:2242 stop:3093 length:852 start_codon:yes stop_codon:yes gene_type:complete